MSIGSRICAACSKTEPDVKFAGTHRKCNSCRAKERTPEMSRKYRRSYLERHPYMGAERVRKYREKFPFTPFYTTSRYLAKKAGVFSDLTKEDAESIYAMPRICSYCGKDGTKDDTPRAFHVDHIIPMVHGGPNSRWNLTWVCNSCNSSKGSSSLVEYRGREPNLTQSRFKAVRNHMAEFSGYSLAYIDELLALSYAFDTEHTRMKFALMERLSQTEEGPLLVG